MADLRCDQCGAGDVLSVKPGMDDYRWGFLVQRGEQMVMLCRACFLLRYGTAPEPRSRRVALKQSGAAKVSP